MRSPLSRVARLLSVALVPAAGLVAVDGPVHAAVTGVVTDGTLTVTGDDANNAIRLRIRPGDSSTLELDVNGDGTFDQAFARNSFTRLVVNAGGGDDDVRLLDGNLNVPDGTTLNGQDGNDVLDDTANDEVLVGGAGDDTFVSEAGDDTLRGGLGNDTFVPFHFGNNIVSGGLGADNVIAFGFDFKADVIVLDAVTTPGHVGVLHADGSWEYDLESIEDFELETFAGDDRIYSIGLPSSLSLDIDAGEGDDIILAGNGNDTIRGGVGADTVVANGGNDVIVGGPGPDALAGGKGNDSFAYNAGDGPDRVDGEGGADSQTVNGNGTANTAETFDVTPSGSRVQLRQDSDAALDMATVEKLSVNTLAGADQVSASPNLPGLTTIDVAFVRSSDDNQKDLLVIDGTADEESFNVGPGVDQHFSVSTGAGRPSFDVVGAFETRIEAAGGDDTLSSSLPAKQPITLLTLAGEGGDDSITSGPATELLIGGTGNDTLRGGRGRDGLRGDNGDDDLFGAAGDDRLEGGLGIDRLDGGTGADTISCGGSGDTVISDATDIVGVDCELDDSGLG